MKVEDVMTRDVVIVRDSSSLDDAAALLLEHKIAAMPVVNDDDALVGMISEADLVRDRLPHDPRLELRRDTHLRSGAQIVREVMGTPVAAVTSYADLGSVADLIVSYNVRSVPVVDGSRVIGIVARRDLLRSLSRSDAEIAADIKARLDAYADGLRPWTVEVEGGIATVRGQYDNASERRVVQMLSSTVSGVKSVTTEAAVPSS